MKFRRTPLAWRGITHDKKRFFMSLGGIAFATILMFTQLGFLNSIFDSQTELLHRLNADLVLSNPSRHRLGLDESFARRRLEQAKQVDGIAHVYPLYVKTSKATWKNPITRRPYLIRVIGLNPDEPVLRNMALEELSSTLHVEDNALMDIRSKVFYGPVTPGTQTELSGHRIRLTGNFDLGVDFDCDGSLIVGENTFRKLFPEEQTGPGISRVALGLVRLQPGLDVELARRRLVAALPSDVRVSTPQELIEQEIVFWRTQKPIGFIFGVGLVIGFIVGIVICSQILYTSVVDRMPLFGTLKAIGYTNGYLVRLVVCEALLLSLLAFVPGVLISWVMYGLLSTLIKLKMFLTPMRILLVLAMTSGMSLIAALIALRKALTADPAEVFK